MRLFSDPRYIRFGGLLAAFSWLHLTDLHLGAKGQDWLWPNIQKAFLDDLRQLHDLCGPWDAVIFTGDLTNSGKRSEFERLEKILSVVFKTLEDLGSNAVLLTVPGNHDLVRPKKESPEAIILGNWQDRAGVLDELIETIGKRRTSPYGKLIRKMFAPYCGWVESSSLPRPPRSDGLMPGDFAATIKKDGLSVGIVGLNSAFLQLSDADFEERLWIDPRQLSRVCDGDPVSWVQNHDACMLLTHHPPRWLAPKSLEFLESDIAPPGRFFLHLFGHLHSPETRTESVGGGEVWRRSQGASLFGLKHYQGSTGPVERRHGYAAGKLSVTRGVGKVRRWPRIAARPGGAWQLVPNNQSDVLQDGQATAPETVNLQRQSGDRHPHTAARAGNPRLVLVSTDEDLADARTKTASYLERSMGMTVIQFSGSTPYEPLPHDIVVLFQGWRWNAGLVSDIWNRAPKGNRFAFLSDDDGDWPPHRLVERPAADKTQTFRQSLHSPTLFSDPLELPDLVGKVVTETLESRPDLWQSATVAIKTWERSYLNASLPAWLSGRTSAGRAYLINAEERTELYQPELYVGLNGTSNRWMIDKDGLPREVQSGETSIADKAKRAIPLGRWASSDKPTRIALVGAPGGGKTVFLTRVAAGLGAACLGRPSALEAEFDLERVRIVGGVLPVPIVLEATRIAKVSTSIRTLIESIGDEIASCGCVRPTFEDMEEDLLSTPFSVVP